MSGLWLFENGKIAFEVVGIKLKGAAGSFREWDDRPALTVKVGQVRRRQRWRTLKKFHLNNAVQDDTWQHDLLAADVTTRAGIPAARVSHARVWLNGRDVGLYVLKEALDKTFLARHFPNNDGNLYDGGFCQESTSTSRRTRGAVRTTTPTWKALREALAIVDLKERWAKVDTLVDVKACVNFMAMELLVNHWDGYTQNRNNYRMYFRPTRRGGSFPRHGSDLRRCRGVHARHAVRARERFRDAQPRLEDALQEAPFGGRSADRARQVVPESGRRREASRAVLEAMDPQAARDYAGRVRALKDRIAARHKFAKEQAAEPEPKPIALSPGKSVALRTWRKAPETEDARLSEEKNAGERQYVIGVGPSGTCNASWRKMVPVSKGRWRFSASVRTEGVVPSTAFPQQGAGVRISGGTRTTKAVGDAMWKTVVFDFEVEEAVRDVEFILELQATKGTAWFNLESLKSKRLE
jgi:hypothetical protein